MIELNACCFCFPLRTGSLIIGYLSLVSSIVLAILDCITLIAYITLLYNGYINEVTGYVAMISVILYLTLMFIAFTIVLLVGLHKERPGHVKGYLILGLKVLVFSVLLAVNIAFTSNESVIIGFVRSVWIVLEIYCLLVSEVITRK